MAGLDPLPLASIPDKAHSENNPTQNPVAFGLSLWHAATEYRQHSILVSTSVPVCCIVFRPFRGQFLKWHQAVPEASSLQHQAYRN